MLKRKVIGGGFVRADVEYGRGGMRDLTLVFKTAADKRRFQADVKGRYGAARYTAALGALFITEAVEALG